MIINRPEVQDRKERRVKRSFIFNTITENKGAHLIYFVFNAEKDTRNYKLDIEKFIFMSWNLKSR